MPKADRYYFRPIPCPTDRQGARALAGGLFGFCEVEVLRRGHSAEILPADAVAAIYPGAAQTLAHACTRPEPILGLDLSRPRIMGVLNVTADSFSDGGLYEDTERAIAHGMAMAHEGVDVLDIGGESTRPGADPIDLNTELSRVMPVIEGLVQQCCPVPISIDTRNSIVAAEALAAGAQMFNDVSALVHDADSIRVAGTAGSVCLMHAQGDPRTMQVSPTYDDVLLDVYDYLLDRIEVAVAGGVERSRIVVDPGIGFGKTMGHNLQLLRRLSIFHGLGCAILLGVSRKRFIGTLSGADEARKRAPGSIAAGLSGLEHGAQILRVHDVSETVQAIRVWQAIHEEQP